MESTLISDNLLKKQTDLDLLSHHIDFHSLKNEVIKLLRQQKLLYLKKLHKLIGCQPFSDCCDQ